MAYIISISDQAEEMWMLKNTAFAEFALILYERYRHDPEVCEQISIAEAIHGLALEGLYAERPTLALRVRDALRDVASSIATGQCALFSYPSEEIAAGFKQSFVELVELLDRFPKSSEG